MTIRNEVLYRLYFVLAMLVISAIVIFSKAVKISVVEGEYWKEKSKEKYVQFRKLEADRGNILASDGSLLATSLPYFDVAFDPNSTGMLESDFAQYVDSLAYCLATYVDPSFTPGAYRDLLIQKRTEGAQYMPIKKDVNFEQIKLIREFPLFNMGQFKGGLIVMPPAGEPGFGHNTPVMSHAWTTPDGTIQARLKLPAAPPPPPRGR